VDNKDETGQDNGKKPDAQKEEQAPNRQYMIWLFLAGIAMGIATRCAFLR